MAASADLDEIEEVNANYILMANLHQASTSGTQTDKAPVYDSDGSAEKMALGYQNPFYLKQAQKKQQSLYDGKVLLEKHDPPVVHDSEETLQLAQESHENMKQLNKEIKAANYTKINHISRVFVSQTAKSREDLYFSNDSKTAKVSKSITIPNVEFSDDTTPGVARKFLNEEAAKFVRDFKSLAKEAYASLAKHKALELEIKRLLRAVASQDIMVPSASKNSRSKNKGAEVEEHHRNLLLSKNKKHMSSACNNFTLDSHNVYSKNSRGKKQTANVSIKEKQKKQKPKVKKPKKVGFIERLATPKPSKPRSLLRWSPTGRLFDQKGKIVDSSESESQSECSNGDNAWQFCDSDLEVAFRRNAYFVRNLEGVDLLKGDRSTNLYTINLHEMASASPICLIARASSTKSWLWHQRLSHLNFDTINDLVRNDLVLGLPKFKYNKKHLCPSCEQGKSKRASHPPKPVPNSRQRLHLLHMDLCGPIRIASINGKRYVLVIMDDYSRYTWVHFLKSKDETPEVIKTFLTRITVLLQSPVIIIRTDNGTKFKNQVLKEYFDSVGISHQMSFVRTPQQNGVVERRNWTLVEAARTMLIFSRAPLFFWAEAIATACFTQNRFIIHRRFNKTPYELINGRKPDISVLHIFRALIFNRRTKKIMETVNVSFDELSAMDFEQRSSKPGLQSMTYGQISSGLDLTYAPSTITTQQPSEATARTVLHAQEPQVRQTSTTSTSIADTAPTPTNSSSHATNIPITSQDVDELNPNAMFDGNSFVNPFATSSTSVAESSSSQNVDPSNMHTMEAIRIFLAYVAHKSFSVFQMDVKTAFLHGSLKEDVYVCQPEVQIRVRNPKKYGMESYDPVGTPMEIKDKLDLDQNGTPIDATKYRSMIGALMYLTSSRPDIVHATCLCARYQAKSTEKHLKEVKRIFRYLRGIVNTGLWYTKDSGFELTGFSDADYAGCKDTFKSISGGAQFLGEKLVSWSSKTQDCTALSTAEAEYVSLSA
nr:putative ribonuclease H-like domain-containing protein [Tanacetum cinerariifolium]